MMWAERTTRFLSAGACAVAAVVGHAGPGYAATAVEVGWWRSSPLVVAPDAPADALVVQGGVAGAMAYGAVRYTLSPDEVPQSLTVRLAPGALSTPTTTLVLCPLTEPITPVAGGQMADAPAFDCTSAVEAPRSGDGTSYRFDVAPLVRDGELAVAILPTAPTDRVVLAPPGIDALATDDPAGAPPDATPSPAGPTTDDGDVAGPSAPATSGSIGLPTPPLPVVPGPAGPLGAIPGAATTPSRSTPPVAAAPTAPDGDASGGSWLPPVAFIGLAVVAALLWRRSGAVDVVVGDVGNGALLNEEVASPA